MIGKLPQDSNPHYGATMEMSTLLDSSINEESFQELETNFYQIKSETNIKQNDNHEKVVLKKDQASENFYSELAVYPKSTQVQIHHLGSNRFINDKSGIETPLLSKNQVPYSFFFLEKVTFQCTLFYILFYTKKVSSFFFLMIIKF